jgi:tRNA (guanine-N1)-methyltransferase
VAHHRRHRTVDDTPYGGGEGMLLKADTLYDAWRSVVPRKSRTTRTILLSPLAWEWSHTLPPISARTGTCHCVSRFVKLRAECRRTRIRNEKVSTIGEWSST